MSHKETILEQADRLHKKATDAWRSKNHHRGAKLDREVSLLWLKNEQRIEKAKKALEAFDEEARTSGEQNASETPPFIGRQDADQYCEWWELAVDSAQCVADCRGET